MQDGRGDECVRFLITKSGLLTDGFASKVGIRLCAAPTARNMIARGKREARRPWLSEPIEESTESAKYLRYYCALSELHGCLRVDPGATRLALLGACPWLSYSAPLALRGLITDF